MLLDAFVTAAPHRVPGGRPGGRPPRRGVACASPRAARTSTRSCRGERRPAAQGPDRRRLRDHLAGAQPARRRASASTEGDLLARGRGATSRTSSAWASRPPYWPTLGSITRAAPYYSVESKEKADFWKRWQRDARPTDNGQADAPPHPRHPPAECPLQLVRRPLLSRRLPWPPPTPASPSSS